MDPISTSAIVFACVFLGAIMGMALRKVLPEHHLSADSKDVVKLGTGLIGTMAALLLGLLVASAKNSYDDERGELIQIAAKFSFLDRILAHYGPGSKPAREQMRRAIQHMIDQMWPVNTSQTAQLDPRASGGEVLYETLHGLSPQTDEQRALKAQALSTAIEIGQLRWLLLAQRESAISMPMLVVVVFWLTIIFLSFGLFTSPNTTVITTFFLCALSVGGALFLILELDQPFGGLIQIPDTALRNALEVIAN